VLAEQSSEPFKSKKMNLNKDGLLFLLPPTFQLFISFPEPKPGAAQQHHGPNKGLSISNGAIKVRREMDLKPNTVINHHCETMLLKEERWWHCSLAGNAHTMWPRLKQSSCSAGMGGGV